MTTASPSPSPTDEVKIARAARHGGDHRGSAAARRARKWWMLSNSRWLGDGERCRCVHCGTWLSFATVEADRIIPGGPYARWNVQPSCGSDNKARSDDSTWVGSLALEVA